MKKKSKEKIRVFAVKLPVKLVKEFKNHCRKYRMTMTDMTTFLLVAETSGRCFYPKKKAA